MDGLECNEIMYSQLERTKRLDAEYYKKESLAIVHRMEELRGKPITEYVQVSDGNHMGISDHFATSGVPYYRGQDIHEFFIEDSAPICIDEKAYESPYMRRSYLHKGDVLVSIVGTIGEVSVVSKDEKATCNCKLAILRPASLDNTSLIALYLRSKYGSDQIKKSKRGSVQMGYLLEDMNQILIPSFSQSFASAVEVAVTKVRILKDESNEKYNEAEDYLLRQINVNINLLSSDNISIKSFSESFRETGRLDAEYYQKKYDELIASIQEGSYSKLCDIVDISKSIEPGSKAYCDEGIPFIRIRDLSKYGLSAPDKYLESGSDYDIPKLYLKKDEILFSKDGSIGIAFKVEKDTKAITSGALLHLKIKDKTKILPDYLTAVLNSEIVKLQAERDAGGSIIDHWKPSEIEKVQIPILPIDKQQDISDRIIYSFELRHKSERLLNAAKQAVEMAIEQSEENAITWLHKIISKIEAFTR